MSANDVVETIVLDENTRIRVEYDNDAESPLTWGAAISKEDAVYQQWAEGDVYGVIVERRWRALMTPMGKPDEPEVEEFVWRDDDAIWSCYLDDTYTAVVCANEYFGTPLTTTKEN